MRIGRKNRGGSRRIVLMMAAMIDCVFLLNIYFLVTAASAPLEGELATQVRTEDANASPSGLAPQVVDVRATGGQAAYTIGQRTMRDGAALTAVLRALPREGGLAVRVHTGPTVADVAAAMQAGRDAGFSEVSYVVAGD